MNANPITPRKDDRATSGSSSGKRGTRNASDQEGWSTASSRGRTPFSVQSDKLKNKPVSIRCYYVSPNYICAFTFFSHKSTNH